MNRPKFQQVKLNRIIKNESRIQSIEIKDKLNQIREKEGKYPDMEKNLAQWIRGTIKGSVPVDTLVVVDQGKYIMHNLYPLSFPSPGEFSYYSFKFSNNW